jgi:hypothetical protein
MYVVEALLIAIYLPEGKGRVYVHPTYLVARGRLASWGLPG